MHRHADGHLLVGRVPADSVEIGTTLSRSKTVLSPIDWPCWWERKRHRDVRSG